MRPILRKHCTVCHSVRTLREVDVSGGLALDSYAAILTDPKKPVIVSRRADQSSFIQRLHEKNVAKRMPLDADPLDAEVVGVLTRWVNAGAPEGTRAEESVATTTARPPAARAKKLDVILSARFSPPKQLAAKPFPGNSPLELVVPAGPLGPVAALAYSADGRHLAVGSYGRVVVWDLTAVHPARALTNVLGAVHDLKYSPDGQLLAVAGGQPSARGDLRLFRTADWSLAATLGGHADVVSGVAFAPDGRRLASASFDRTVRVWDVVERRALQTLTGHSDFVYAVAWSPKGDLLASASKDRTVKVVDARTGQSKYTFSGMDQDVLAVAVTADGKYVVSSGNEPQLYWWDLATGERARRVGGHDTAVHELTTSRDGKVVASAGADRTMRFWNPANGQPVRTAQVGSLVYAAALRPDGKQAAAGSFDGLVRLFEPASGKLLLTLLTAPGGSDAPDWLALTPEGYVAGSDAWIGQGRFRVAGQELPADVLWSALRQPDLVAKLLAGVKVPEPAVKR